MWVRGEAATNGVRDSLATVGNSVGGQAVSNSCNSWYYYSIIITLKGRNNSENGTQKRDFVRTYVHVNTKIKKGPGKVFVTAQPRIVAIGTYESWRLCRPPVCLLI